jgi:hypothetical protein
MAWEACTGTTRRPGFARRPGPDGTGAHPFQVRVILPWPPQGVQHAEESGDTASDEARIGLQRRSEAAAQSNMARHTAFRLKTIKMRC